MRILLILIELGLAIGVIGVVVSQIILPLLQGRRILPILRKTENLKGKIRDAEEDIEKEQLEARLRELERERLESELKSVQNWIDTPTNGDGRKSRNERKEKQ